MATTLTRYITIGFDASREPLDELFWCEAETGGAWTNITVCDRIRTRREVVERIAELDRAVIGVDFPLSFPKTFIESLVANGIKADHADIAKHIREDLKKNTDDGIRKWIDLMGVYRESHTESAEEAAERMRFTPHRRDGDRRARRDSQPYERRSLVERWRRIDRILRRQFPDAVASTIGIQYNRLTRRYEFVDANARGRSALVGISMLEQARELKDDIAIWPFDRPGNVTVAEVFPKLFERHLEIEPNALKDFFDREEDNALFVAPDVREAVYTHEKARTALASLLGMLSAERRQDKTLRPIRDYKDSFYSNDEVRLEGWIYGIGFKELGKPKYSEESVSKESS